MAQVTSASHRPTQLRRRGGGGCTAPASYLQRVFNRAFVPQCNRYSCARVDGDNVFRHSLVPRKWLVLVVLELIVLQYKVTLLPLSRASASTLLQGVPRGFVRAYPRVERAFVARGHDEFLGLILAADPLLNEWCGVCVLRSVKYTQLSCQVVERTLTTQTRLTSGFSSPKGTAYSQ